MRFVISLLCVCAASPAFAAVGVSNAWAPPSLIGTTTGVAYVTLHSTSDDALVSITSPVAKSIELHTHLKENGILRMRKLDSIPLPANTKVTLEPRGLHIMLYKLTRPLKEGDRFKAILHFTHAKPQQVTVQVSQKKLLEFLR